MGSRTARKSRPVVKWYNSGLHPAVRERLGPKPDVLRLYSPRQKQKLYIGYSKDLRRRIQEHKNGKVYTTRRMKNPKLIYYEAYNFEISAKDRERKLKQFGSSYKGLIKRIKLKI